MEEAPRFWRRRNKGHRKGNMVYSSTRYSKRMMRFEIKLFATLVAYGESREMPSRVKYKRSNRDKRDEYGGSGEDYLCYCFDKSLATIMVSLFPVILLGKSLNRWPPKANSYSVFGWNFGRAHLGKGHPFKLLPSNRYTTITTEGLID